MGSTTIELCAECCDPCAYLPDSLNATIADLESCGCVASAIFDAPTALNGTHTGITKVVSPPIGAIQSFWAKELGEVGVTTYSEPDCTGTTESGTSYWTLFILCLTDGTLFLQILGSQSGYPDAPDFTPLLNGGFSAEITTFATPTANGIDCSDGLSYIAGGTGQIDIP